MASSTARPRSLACSTGPAQRSRSAVTRLILSGRGGIEIDIDIDIDARFDIDEMFGSDDRVAVRWTLQATHTGPFAGLPPTQKKATVRGISLYRLHNGKITETRNQADLLALFTQLGTIEQKKSATASA